MPISQTSTDEKLNNLEMVMEKLAREAALRVVEQPHYWRGITPILQVSKSDLVTDITFEVKKLLVDLFMQGAGMAQREQAAK